MNPFCPYCKEEHGYYDIELTPNEQTKLDKYYSEKQWENVNELYMLIDEMHDPPLIVRRKFIFCVCRKKYEKLVVVSKFSELKE